MKKFVLIVLSLASVATFAADPASTMSGSLSVAGASNLGNSQNITFTSPSEVHSVTTIDGTQTIKNVPSVSGPPLTTSNDTCMGSSSGSANAPGIGISIGSTWTDKNCKMLKNARELWNMGMKGAAMALMCKDPDNREALELTGYVCPSASTKKD